MYTRSYGNRGVRPHLPPDYSGTALVAAGVSDHSSNSVTEGVGEGAPRNINAPARSSRRPSNIKAGVERGMGSTIVSDTHVRRPALKDEDRKERDDGFWGRAPFAGEAGAGATSVENAGATKESELLSPTSAQDGGLPSYRKLFDPDKLKSDDLLLLGLIVLLFNDSQGQNGEKDMTREALLILAALYLSGL